MSTGQVEVAVRAQGPVDPWGFPGGVPGWRLGAAADCHVGCPPRFLDSGPVFKLAFGPKAFIVVSDPVVVRHLLKVRGGPGVDATEEEGAKGGSAAQQFWRYACCAQGRSAHMPGSRRMRGTTTRACWPRSWSPSWARASSRQTSTRGKCGGGRSCLVRPCLQQVLGAHAAPARACHARTGRSPGQPSRQADSVAVPPAPARLPQGLPPGVGGDVWALHAAHRG